MLKIHSDKREKTFSIWGTSPKCSQFHAVFWNNCQNHILVCWQPPLRRPWTDTLWFRASAQLTGLGQTTVRGNSLLAEAASRSGRRGATASGLPRSLSYGPGPSSGESKAGAGSGAASPLPRSSFFFNFMQFSGKMTVIIIIGLRVHL